MTHPSVIHSDKHLVILKLIAHLFQPTLFFASPINGDYPVQSLFLFSDLTNTQSPCFPHYRGGGAFLHAVTHPHFPLV